MLGLVYKGMVYSAFIYTAKADLRNKILKFNSFNFTFMVIKVYFAIVKYIIQNKEKNKENRLMFC